MSLSRILYILLLFIASWSTYYLFDKSQGTTVQVAPNLELPMFSGKNLENISFNSEGIRSHSITSTNLDHYAKSGETIFENPKLSVFRDGETVEWIITARRAVLDEEQVLTLYDNVSVENLLPGASFKSMSTDELRIELISRNFQANNSVLLIGPQFKTEGQAMKGSFEHNNATLFNHVQGRYETLTP